MTKAKRADEILKAARSWQNGHPRSFTPDGIYSPLPESEMETTEFICYEMADEYVSRTPFDLHATLLASAALSEVAGMGYDLEDAE